MNAQTPITLPTKRQTRNVIFGIRLTPDEREIIAAFAHKINFPASEMARHFVLQAIAYYTERLAEKGGVNGSES
jgi:hypothetical protein